MSFKYGGFPQQTLEYLENIRANNSREWFTAHRADYQRWYVEPAMAFVHAAGTLLQQWRPGICAQPKILGSIFRINRDTRIKNAVGPYKDHIDFWFWEGDRRRAASGYFLRLTPEFVGIGAGRHGFDREQRQRLRGMVDDEDARIAELIRILAEIESEGYVIGGGPHGESFLGAAVEGARQRVRRHRGIFVHHDEPAQVAIEGAALMQACERIWRDLTPLHAWLVDCLQ
jgi:uncharacterized protein (TIGR02453 family)